MNEATSYIANGLGMSWIGGDSTWQLEDMNLADIDPNDPNKPRSHNWRMKNTGTYHGYGDTHPTSLEYFDWTTEVADVMFGKPIITDIKPTSIDTTRYPSSPTSYSLNYGSSHSISATLTDSYTWNVGAKLTLKKGNPNIVEVAAEFSGSFSGTNSNAITTAGTSSTSATVVIPAHREASVNQLSFSQRTSLPYTARVKLIPRVRFTGGFVRAGNKYLKHPGDDDRTYGNQVMGRMDGLKDDAKADSDPWKVRPPSAPIAVIPPTKQFPPSSANTLFLSAQQWRDCINDNPWMQNLLDWLATTEPYEVFVKGKWEGVTGTYAVTTVTPKATLLSMLPTDS